MLLAGADVVKGTEGRVAAPQWPGARDPAGVREQDTFTVREKFYDKAAPESTSPALHAPGSVQE